MTGAPHKAPHKGVRMSFARHRVCMRSFTIRTPNGYSYCRIRKVNPLQRMVNGRLIVEHLCYNDAKKGNHLPPILKKALIVLSLLIALNVGFVWYGKASFNATFQGLAKAFADQNATTFDITHTSSPSVERFLQSIGAKPYKTVVIEIEGTYRKKPASKPIAIHALSLLRPSPDWLWAMTLDPNPLITFNALETYHDGRAALKTMLFGIVPTGEIRDEAFARSELARLLAYAPFNPLLLASPSVTCQTVDPHTLRATIHDGHLSATVTFTLDDQGRITAASSTERVLKNRQGIQHLPWSIAFGPYRRTGDFAMPQTAAETWQLADGPFEQLRFTLKGAKAL